MAEPLALQAAVPAYTTAIFEGAQGVLLDEWRGFHPHTTWSTVTLHHALAMVEESDAEEVCTLGVTRAYMTRHGAGPLPTWSPELDAKLCRSGQPDERLARDDPPRLAGPGAAALRGRGRLAGRSTAWWSTAWTTWPAFRRKSAWATGALQTRRSSDCRFRPYPGWLRKRDSRRCWNVLCRFAAKSLSPRFATRLRASVAPIAITGTGPAWQDRTLRDLRFRRHVKEQQLPPALAVGRHEHIPDLAFA